jgi:4-hydroxythreonine-4-phosphate dehydrogenase
MTGPSIGVTLGDPGGVGPEIVLKALAAKPVPPGARVVVFGDSESLEAARRETGIGLAFETWDGSPEGKPGIFLQDIPFRGGKPAGRKPDRENGAASFRFFEAGIGAAEEGLVAGLVTGPVSKASWHLAGIPWRGHTEYLEARFPGAIMSFWSDRLKVALFSHHCPLGEAVGRVKKEPLLGFLRALDRSLKKLGRANVELLVAGLNPHAGEGGMLGAEEGEEIRPAVEEAGKEGIRASGPYPPDTVFLKARERDNAVAVALYHDQGLIAFKSVAFATGVNATLGLPFPRTSPDHGTAFDIAGRGAADPRSMIEAIRLARAFSASVS